MQRMQSVTDLAAGFRISFCNFPCLPFYAGNNQFRSISVGSAVVKDPLLGAIASDPSPQESELIGYLRPL